MGIEKGKHKAMVPAMQNIMGQILWTDAFSQGKFLLLAEIALISITELCYLTQDVLHEAKLKCARTQWSIYNSSDL